MTVEGKREGTKKMEEEFLSRSVIPRIPDKACQDEGNTGSEVQTISTSGPHGKLMHCVPINVYVS